MGRDPSDAWQQPKVSSFRSAVTLGLAILVLGHEVAAMGAGFRTLLLRSAEWAATDQATLPPPAIWPSTPAAVTAAGIDLNATLSAVAHYR